MNDAYPLAGDALAIASAVSFAVSNVTIARGARPEAEDNGAFVSLLLTTLIAGAAWLAAGMARGFEPVFTWSAHWLADRALRGAVARYLEREAAAVTEYADAAARHTPFRA